MGGHVLPTGDSAWLISPLSCDLSVFYVALGNWENVWGFLFGLEKENIPPALFEFQSTS